MKENNINELVQEHFDLIQAKAEIVNNLTRNQANLVKELVKSGQFEFFTVNWQRLHKIILRRPNHV